MKTFLKKFKEFMRTWPKSCIYCKYMFVIYDKERCQACVKYNKWECT